MSAAVYIDDAENEYEFYPNGELFLFSSENGASINEFQPGTRNNSEGLEEKAKEFIEVLLPGTDLAEYNHITKTSSSITDRVLFTKKHGTPYAETITVALFPNGSLSWLQNSRIFLDELSAEQIAFFDQAYQAYASRFQTYGAQIESYSVYYQRSGNGAITAQYITVLKDAAGAYYTDARVFELPDPPMDS